MRNGSITLSTEAVIINGKRVFHFYTTEEGAAITEDFFICHDHYMLENEVDFIVHGNSVYLTEIGFSLMVPS